MDDLNAYVGNGSGGGGGGGGGGGSGGGGGNAHAFKSSRSYHDLSLSGLSGNGQVSHGKHQQLIETKSFLVSSYLSEGGENIQRKGNGESAKESGGSVVLNGKAMMASESVVVLPSGYNGDEVEEVGDAARESSDDVKPSSISNDRSSVMDPVGDSLEQQTNGRIP